MKLHHHPRHHRPHLLTARIKELREFGASDAVLAQVIADVARSYRIEMPAESKADLTERAAALDLMILEQREKRLLGILQPLEDARILITGEMPPHVIEELLTTKIGIIQTHPHGPNGECPPHLKHFERQFPNFNHVASPQEVLELEFTAIATHAYRCENGLLVSRHTSFAARFWPQSPLLIFLADHRAPHHVEVLRDRETNLEIPE